MAYDDEDFPPSWSDGERDLYDELVDGEPELIEDVHLQMLFHGSLFDREIDHETRGRLHDELERYLDAVYDIDFNEVFDWEAYREAYDAAA